jgi:hypothetical protein
VIRPEKHLNRRGAEFRVRRTPDAAYEFVLHAASAGGPVEEPEDPVQAPVEYSRFTCWGRNRNACPAAGVRFIHFRQGPL